MGRMVITEALDAQGRIEPGTEGWWQVWGASARDIQVGDMIMVIWGKGTDTEEFAEYLVAELPLQDVCGKKVISDEGESFWVGALQPVQVLRRGTHHTLSPYCR